MMEDPFSPAELSVLIRALETLGDALPQDDDDQAIIDDLLDRLSR